MSYLLRMSLLGTALCAASAAQTCRSDDNSYIRALLKSTPDPLGISFVQRAVRNLGDCAAVSIAANIRLSDLQNPATGERMERLLEVAFSTPSYTRAEPYKQAGVGLLLLDVVAEHATDETTRLNARNLIGRTEPTKSGPATVAHTCRADTNEWARSALKIGPGIAGLSFTQQQARSLGDCVALGLAASLRLKDLQSPNTSYVVVRLLEFAFSMPSMIPEEQYKQPRVALLLLDLVAEHATDATTRLSARELTRQLEPAKGVQ